MVTSDLPARSVDLARVNRVANLRLDPLSMSAVIGLIETWIGAGTHTHTVTLNNVDSAANSLQDADFRDAINRSSLSLPDGMPLVWFLRWKGCRHATRICGPDLFLRFCEATHHKPYRHFFYGGADGVPEALVASLRSRFPKLRVAGTYSPPFRPLTLDEDAHVIREINHSKPDVIWVGLGCPKQEKWMATHQQHLDAPVLIGVGQVFDVYSGRTRRAPAWMCNTGLEWLYRLQQEPVRLWRRYLLRDFPFLLQLIVNDLKVRRSPTGDNS